MTTNFALFASRITENLGSGQFGHVVKGLWQSPDGVLPVAVKMLKEGTEENDEVRFLQEAAINGQFRHRNVVKLHGVVTLGRPVSQFLYTRREFSALKSIILTVCGSYYYASL